MSVAQKMNGKSRKNGKAKHDPIEDLPFIQVDKNWTPKEGKKSGRGPRDMWAVKGTGDTVADCDLGGEMARQALDFIREDGFRPLLGYILLDGMLPKAEKLTEDDKMVIVGFMDEIARCAVYGRKILEAVENLNPRETIVLKKKPDGARVMETGIPLR